MEIRCSYIQNCSGLLLIMLQCILKKPHASLHHYPMCSKEKGDEWRESTVKYASFIKICLYNPFLPTLIICNKLSVLIVSCFPFLFPFSHISLSYLYPISASLKVHPPLLVDKWGSICVWCACVRFCHWVWEIVCVCCWQWARSKREGCNQDTVRTCSTCSLLSSVL